MKREHSPMVNLKYVFFVNPLFSFAFSTTSILINDQISDHIDRVKE